jgi:hypothetical protein
MSKGRNSLTTPPSDLASELVQALGELGPEDSYFVTHNSEVYGAYSGARRWDSVGAGILSALPFTREAQAGVRFFITHAIHDAVVYSPEIPKTLNDLTWGSVSSDLNRTIDPHPELQALISGAEHLPDYQLGFSRLGAMNILGHTPAEDILIPMPQYVAGHSVSMRAPAELKADIRIWLARTL